MNNSYFLGSFLGSVFLLLFFRYCFCWLVCLLMIQYNKTHHLLCKMFVWSPAKLVELNPVTFSCCLFAVFVHSVLNLITKNHAVLS